MEKKNELKKDSKKTDLKTVSDKFINTLSTEAEKVMNGLGLEMKPEVKSALFNLGLACEKAIKDKGITWNQVNKDGLPSKLLYYAQLGLNPANGELYILPYREKDGYVLNFEESYLGKKKKVKKFSSDNLLEAIAFVVREEDIYEPEVDLFKGDTLVFNPKPFNDGRVIGAVCYLKFKDETRNRIVEMSLKELEQVKEASRDKMNGKLSPAWKKWESEMYKKAVLKRALKDIEIEVPTEYQNAYLETEDLDNANYDFDFEDQKLTSVEFSNKENKVIDGEVTEIKNDISEKDGIDEANIVEFE